MIDPLVEIKLIQETEVSYDQIHDIIYRAHIVNREKGLFYRTAIFSGEMIKERVGDGLTFVAFVENKAVATASVCLHIGRHWYDKGLLVAHYCFDAVLPEYQGKGIMSIIDGYRDSYALSSSVKVIRSGTAEGNIAQRNKFMHQGFVPVDYRYFDGNDFYSVLYARWMDDKYKRSKFVCVVHYCISMFYTKIRFNLAHIFRRFRKHN